MIETIKTLIDANANLTIPARDLAPADDLYQFGLTPYGAVRLLLSVENAFDVEFPRRLLNKNSMASIEAIGNCLLQLLPEEELLAAA
jgi:acyl carrier protein